jgi:hypothetical protein
MARALQTDPIYQLEENLQCTVCLGVLTDPRTLPCCHSFCKVCLEGIVETLRSEAPRDRPIREFHVQIAVRRLYLIPTNMSPTCHGSISSVTW